MATNTIFKSKHSSTDDEEGSIKRLKELGNASLLRSEIEYSQGSNYGMKSGTKDASTELRIETDDVQITTEIYSMTDLPSSLQADEKTEPEPGTIVPEYYGEQCAILRAYRCKGVNVTESDFPESCRRKISSDQSHQLFEKNGKGEDVRLFRLVATMPCIPIDMIKTQFGGPMCQETCPNITIAECSQTEDTISLKAEEQDDDLEVVTTSNISMLQEELTSKKILSTVQESEEEDDKVLETANTDEKQNKERNERRSVCVGPADSLPADKETNTNSRKPRRNTFETETIISNRSSIWFERPRIEKYRRAICTRTNGSCSSNARISGHLSYCANVRPSASHCMTQCEILRNGPRFTYSTATEINSCESFANSWCHVLSSRWRNPNEYWSTADCWTPKSHQLGRINNTYGCSITGGSLEICARYSPNCNNACGRYYLNVDKAYNTSGRNYPCYSGYNICNANMCHNTATNQTFRHTPANYCYSFNSWC